MNCFRLEVVEGGPDAHSGEVRDGVLRIPRKAWRYILSLGQEIGALSRLNAKVEVQCGVCGSFVVSAREFYSFVCELEENVDDDSLWLLSRALVEEKFKDEETFWKYWRDGGEDPGLLRDGKGDLIYDECSGWPLGLAYEDAAVKIAPGVCPSCDRLFSAESERSR